ncbi:MAG: hypothetical protein GVY17_09980 [Cyanobacteria bacterium]|nr:hypothetical protein [Cyanobacteria bacterium GSL.Bin21]
MGLNKGRKRIAPKAPRPNFPSTSSVAIALSGPAKDCPQTSPNNYQSLITCIMSGLKIDARVINVTSFILITFLRSK